MGRTAWLQDRRMQKFRDVLSRWERGDLSLMEAGELLGVSERQFRRYRDPYEEQDMEGLVDRRLGKVSPLRVPKVELERMLDLYRGTYRGWNVKHFHEHLVRDHNFAWGYTWTKTQLHAAGLLSRAPRRGAHRRKRERKPCEGMMLHQDASREAWLKGQPPLDLIVTMDDATSAIYSAFLVEEEGTASSLAGLLETFAAKGLPSSLYTDRGSHYFHTPTAGEAVDRTHLTQVGRGCRGQRLDQGDLSAGPQRPFRQAAGAARDGFRGGAGRRSAWSRATIPSPSTACACNCPRVRYVTITSRRGCACTPIPTARSRSSTDRAVSPATRPPAMR